MNTRESRTSIGARHNDTLFEFETFKKKFLLANKHITKLNSTLSVRIEELNAQISSLYVENLRLRASEIALVSQLKREREKSRKVMAEAEAASFNLTKHLTHLRQSFGISLVPPTPPAPASPRARRRPPNPDPSPLSPQLNRVSQPPGVPGIFEEEEPPFSAPDVSEPQSSPLSRRPSKSRMSSSKWPLPARAASPTSSDQPVVINAPPVITSIPKLRKASRRQSGLLAMNTESLSAPRAPSPAFGSPIRREAGLAEEQDEIAVLSGQLVEVDIEVSEIQLPVKKRKSRGKEKEKIEETESSAAEAPPLRERKRTKERVEEQNGNDGGGKPGCLKDVTNSRAVLSSTGNTIVHEQDVVALAKASTFDATAARASSPYSAGDTESIHLGRERRARKSVNYTEPKLNTKMRKPDPLGTVPSSKPKKRSSASAVLTTYTPLVEDENDADNDTEARSSLEQPSQPPALQLRLNGTVIDPALFPLPPSRPSSSASVFSPPPSIVRTSSLTTASSSTTSPSVKKKKSRSQIVIEDNDEESDGAEADSEYGRGKNWVNVEGRKKVGTGSGNSKNVQGVDDIRRHSLAM